MSEILLEARHVTRRFPTNDGRELVACNDVNLKLYRGKQQLPEALHSFRLMTK